MPQKKTNPACDLSTPEVPSEAYRPPSAGCLPQSMALGTRSLHHLLPLPLRQWGLTGGERAPTQNQRQGEQRPAELAKTPFFS